MSGSVSCKISPELNGVMKKFRFAKNLGDCAVITLKIDRKNYDVLLEEESTETSFEEIAEDLPEDSPRYPFYLLLMDLFSLTFLFFTFLLLSFKQELSDGRVKFPLVFIHYCPPGVSAELNMLYATTRNSLMKESGINRVIELCDKDDLSKNWLEDQLA
ncbi:hypothetical protein DSO57_1037195 [Entomophthora muscae]|uniref:Uncharacterized protein n=1 Tax=Entomophthora muscae TaxID=34485 RepID=A0ACC2RDT8_9FUNG|nr:hypothetical protein DSO57_1037195 [Entomophthora muscae]